MDRRILILAAALLCAGTALRAADQEKDKHDKKDTKDAQAEAKDAAPESGGNKVYLDGWSYSRERKTITGSNKVTARLTLKNVSEADLANVGVSVTFHSGLGENVGGPLTQSLGTVKPKESKQIQVAGEFIPVFGGYEVVVTYGGGKEIWQCNSDLGNPEPKAGKGPDNGACLVLLGTEVGPDKFNRLAGQLRIKNTGKQEAKNCKVNIVYYAAVPMKDPKKPDAMKALKVGEWSGPLGDGKFPGAAERVVPLTVPQPMPKGAVHYEIKVACDEIALEQQMSGGEFQNLNDLEAAKFAFKRSGAKQENLDVACALRNGMSEGLSGIKLTIQFFLTEKGEKKLVKSHTQEVPGTLAAGAVQNVAFTIAGMPKYDAFEQALEFGKAGGAAAQGSKPAKEPVFTNAKTVEVLLKTFNTADDGTVSIVCAARNGCDHTVKDIQVIVHFFDAAGKEVATGVKILPDSAPSGEVRNFILRAENAKGYANYRSEVKFEREKPLTDTAGATP
ncbi:MAG: hypothetical protein KIS92_17850 [Planctomycetota bacterium]|nr:hypothetical protein [Planctomycetota bacterium]